MRKRLLQPIKLSPTKRLADAQSQTIDDGSSYNCNQMKETFKIMQQMRKDRIFCDVTLLVGNVEIPAHKTVLSASSRYFYAMLVLSNDIEQNRVAISDITPDALITLINYIYTGEIEITEINVVSLLQAAHILMLVGVKETCCKILKGRLTSSNCLGTKLIAEKYECLQLLDDTLSYVNGHFLEIVKCEEFTSLTYEQLSKIISRNVLTMPKEETIYEALILWVKHDLKQRRKYLVVLMQHVRFSSIPITYIAEHVSNELLIKGDVKCKDFIIEAFQHHYGQASSNSESDRNENRSLILPINQSVMGTTLPRLNVMMPPYNHNNNHNNIQIPCSPLNYLQNSQTVLVALGGQSEEAMKTLEYYDFQTHCWSEVYQMPLKGRVNAVNIKSKFYVMNQTHSNSHPSDMYELNINTNTWKQYLFENYDMPVEFDKSFFMGNSLNDIRRFDFQTKSWLPPIHSPILTTRKKYGAGVVNTILYVVGGIDQKSAECYDGYSWKMLDSMQSIRYDMGIGVVNSTLYAIGGHDGSSVLKSVEIFDTNRSTWKQVAPMNLPRQRPGVVIRQNMVYAIGGWDGKQAIASVEVYNPISNQWRMLNQLMKVARSDPAVGVVNK